MKTKLIIANKIKIAIISCYLYNIQEFYFIENRQQQKLQTIDFVRSLEMSILATLVGAISYGNLWRIIIT